MSIELTTKSLQIGEGKSQVKTVSMNADFASLPEKLRELGLQYGYMIIWQIHRISWGRLDAGQFIIAADTPKDELILELRVFNEQSELYLQKQGNHFVGRYRDDNDGALAEYVDSASRFWGKHNDNVPTEIEGFITLIDADRKLSMTLPEIDAKAKYYALETRSYIGINDKTAQAGYIDYRFKAIIPADMKGDEE